MDAIADELDVYAYLHASRAVMLRRLGWCEESRAAHVRALEPAGNASERRFLQARLEGLASIESTGRQGHRANHGLAVGSPRMRTPVA